MIQPVQPQPFIQPDPSLSSMDGWQVRNFFFQRNHIICSHYSISLISPAVGTERYVSGIMMQEAALGSDPSANEQIAMTGKQTLPYLTYIHHHISNPNTFHRLQPPEKIPEFTGTEDSGRTSDMKETTGSADPHDMILQPASGRCHGAQIIEQTFRESFWNKFSIRPFREKTAVEKLLQIPDHPQNALPGSRHIVARVLITTVLVDQLERAQVPEVDRPVLSIIFPRLYFLPTHNSLKIKLPSKAAFYLTTIRGSD